MTRVAVVSILALTVLVAAGSAAAPGPMLVSVTPVGKPATGSSLGPSLSEGARFIAFTSTARDLTRERVPGVFVRDLRTRTTTLVSVTATGRPANGPSWGGVVTPNGRYVVFCSLAANLAPNDVPPATGLGPDYWRVLDTFVHDRRTRRTVRASVARAGGNPSDWACAYPDHRLTASISADGRFVAFEAAASNLVRGDTNGRIDVFVRDLRRGRTLRASIGPGGRQANDDSYPATVSASGRYVFFCSRATNLVRGGTIGQHVFAHDLRTRRTTLVTRRPDGRPLSAGGCAMRLAASANGRYALVATSSRELTAGLANATPQGSVVQSFLIDRRTWQAIVVTRGVDGEGADDLVEIAGMSADGRYVAYASPAQNLVAGDRNSLADIFLFDRLRRTTTRISVRADGRESVRYHGSTFAAVAPDGRFVAWHSDADDLVPGDQNGEYDVFLRGPLR